MGNGLFFSPVHPFTRSPLHPEQMCGYRINARRGGRMTEPDPTPEPPPTPEFVFREYAPRIFHIAKRMLGNDADAEDVTQDVLLQVIRKLDTFRGDSQLTTWLHRVTVNAALAHRQKRANRQKRETTEAAEDVLDMAPAN